MQCTLVDITTSALCRWGLVLVVPFSVFGGMTLPAYLRLAGRAPDMGCGTRCKPPLRPLLRCVVLLGCFLLLGATAAAVDRRAAPGDAHVTATMREASAGESSHALGAMAVVVGAAVDTFWAEHKLVVGALGGVAATLRRFQTVQARAVAVHDLRQLLRRDITEANLQAAVFAIRHVMNLLSDCGSCSTFFHHVAPTPGWLPPTGRAAT